jgi:SAM-dependent methyltransferase
MPDWFADDSFWAELYPFEFPETVIATGEAQIEHAIDLSGVRGGPALDLGCGPGRHAIALAKRGFCVTAVDISRFHLAKAREQAEAAGLPVEFVESDMRSFVRPEAYNLALSLFTSFGYFEDKQDDLRVLRNVHRSLKAGGVLLMDIMGKERLARIFQPTVSQRAPDGVLLIRRHEIVDDWTRVRNEWIIVKNDQTRTLEFVVRVYSGQELKELLGAAGFPTIKLYGGLDGRPYGFDAQRLVAVAGK